MGVILSRRGRPPDIVGACASCILDPTHPGARRRLGIRLFRIETRDTVAGLMRASWRCQAHGGFVADFAANNRSRHRRESSGACSVCRQIKRHKVLDARKLNVQSFRRLSTAEMPVGLVLMLRRQDQDVRFLALSSRLLRNQKSIEAGKYSKVRKVAPNRPPHMVIAIGPQTRARQRNSSTRSTRAPYSTTGRVAAGQVALAMASRARKDVGRRRSDMVETEITALRMS